MLRLKARFTTVPITTTTTFTFSSPFIERNPPITTTCDRIMYSLSHKDPIFTRRFHIPTQNPSVPLPRRFDANSEGIVVGVGRGNGNNRFYYPLAYVRDRQVAISPADFRVEGKKDGKLVNGMQWGSHFVFKGRSMAETIVVAVDVDEVLGNFLSALNRFIAEHYASNHSLSEYRVYEFFFFKIWKCSPDVADLRVHEFFKNGIHPVPCTIYNVLVSPPVNEGRVASNILILW